MPKNKDVKVFLGDTEIQGVTDIIVNGISYTTNEIHDIYVDAFAKAGGVPKEYFYPKED